MGSLILPDYGIAYVDTQVFIYSIEKISPYYDLLIPLWEASDAGKLTIITSELTIMEVLTGPMKGDDERLVATYENLLDGTEVQLVPIDKGILREAARFRAQTSLRTPDAIHAATALSIGCSTFITNDISFRAIASLPVQILKDLIVSP